MPTSNDAVSLAQNIVVIAAFVAALIATGRQTYKAWRSRKGAGGETPAKLPSDALAKPHPDPTVARLEADYARQNIEVKRQAERLGEQQDELTDLSKEVSTLRRELRNSDDRSYKLQRIVRRLLDAWPGTTPAPHLTPEEWELVGIDEETMPQVPK